MRRGAALALFALVAASLLSRSDARNTVAKGADGKNNNNVGDDGGDELGPSSRPRLAALGGEKHTFEVANDVFLLDGEPFRILAGEYHYQRTHPAHWRDRLRRLSAMGVNAIQTYTMWHLHEPFRPGSYDFSGPADLERFLDAAAAEGLWVLLRPGPYVCAEVDAGGLPWWLHDPSAGSGAGPQLKARTADPAFLGFVDTWWGKLLPMMRPRMAVNGGNVLMVQMENEYGSFNTSCGTDKEGKYLRHLISTARTHLGDDVLFYTTDPPGVAQHGSLPGEEILTLVDYGPGVDAAWAQSKADDLNPPGLRPPFNTEFYTGWLTHWGELMANTSVPVMSRSLEGILALPNRIVPFLVPQSAKAIAATTEAANLALVRAGAEPGRAGSTGGVSLYMGAGGTNFGFQAGANLAGRAYEPDVTSYDYDCPIGEDGHTGQRGIGGDGNKFEAVRAALLAAAEADAVAARARLEAAEAAAAKSTKLGRDEVAAASSSSSSVQQQQQRLESLRRGAERAAADARFPDLPPPPPVAAFDPVELSLVGDLLSDAILGSLAGVGGGGVLLKFNATTRRSGSGWSNGGIGAVGVPGPALPAMEALGQASGLVLYRATVPRAALALAPSAATASSAAAAAAASSSSAPPRPASSVLDLGSTVHDYGGVYLDGAPVAALDRASFSTAVALPRLPALQQQSSSSDDDNKKKKRSGAGGSGDGGNVTLDILVHEMGRVNFGCVTLDHKGLETDAVTLDGERKRERGEREEFFFFFFTICEREKRERERRRERESVPSPAPHSQATGFPNPNGIAGIAGFSSSVTSVFLHFR